jgi:HD-GYP domain-containing protein (c-di-GMP phosphodiesterase class II)
MLRLNPGSFISIPTMLVSYDCGIAFDVYIRKGENFFLFAKHGELTDAHKHRLSDHSVDTLYIHADDMKSYDEYISYNFSNLLQDNSIPIDDRSELLYGYSLGLSKALLDSESMVQPTVEHRDKLLALADSTFDFLSRKKGASRSIGRLLSHNYKTYSHCINVSIYVMLAMVKLGYDRRASRAVGAGAVLHDIGKTSRGG